MVASLNILNFSTEVLQKNPKAFKSQVCKMVENKKENEEYESVDPVLSIKPAIKIKQEFSKLVKGMPEDLIEHIVERFSKGEIVIDLLNGIHLFTIHVIKIKFFLSFGVYLVFYKKSLL